MIHFISTFFNYIVGIATAILGFFLLKKNSSLKEANNKINNENISLKQQIDTNEKINDNIDKKISKIKRHKYAGNSKRVHKNLL